MKRVNGIWYVNACSFTMLRGRIEKTSHWLIAGDFDRACMMMLGGHI